MGLKSVDKVLEITDGLETTIRQIAPDIIIKGKEFASRENLEDKLAAELGINLLFSSGEISFSATKLMSLEEDNNNNLTPADPKRGTIHKTAQISLELISNKIAKIQNLKVLVIGDLIVDKYVFCDPIGMSQEDPTIVIKALQEKKFLGGAGIVAAHAAALGANSSFVGLVGDDDAAPYAKSCLKNYNVSSHLITDTTRPTTTKTRFRASDKTMLRVNQLREHDLVGLPLLETKKVIAKLAPDADVILFSDFSYGLLTKEIIEFTLSNISRKNTFLAGDSQSSSQMGDLSKFVKMNLVAPTEREARLATNNKNSSLPELAKELRKKFQHDHIILTMGSEGLIVTSLAIDEFTDRLPALENTVIDVAGAGDSMFAASSQGWPLECPYGKRLFLVQ